MIVHHSSAMFLDDQVRFVINIHLYKALKTERERALDTIFSFLRQTPKMFRSKQQSLVSSHKEDVEVRITYDTMKDSINVCFNNRLF